MIGWRKVRLVTSAAASRRHFQTRSNRFPWLKKLFAVLYGVYGYAPAGEFEIMKPNTILWIYIVLLVAGGLVGFLKAKSKASLIASVSFAAILSLCAARVIFQPYVAEIVLAVLLVFFGWRLTKSKKFMPNGLMIILTIATLAFRNIRF